MYWLPIMLGAILAAMAGFVLIHALGGGILPPRAPVGDFASTTYDSQPGGSSGRHRDGNPIIAPKSPD